MKDDIQIIGSTKMYKDAKIGDFIDLQKDSSSPPAVWTERYEIVKIDDNGNVFGKYVENTSFEEFDIEDMAKDGKKISRSQKEYNKEVDAYKWYVVNKQTKKIESGFEHKSDAIDLQKDMQYPEQWTVMSKITLAINGIENPNEKWKSYEKGTKIDFNKLSVEALNADYPKKNPEWVWDNWTKEQRIHFLTDHDKKITVEIADDLSDEPYKNLIEQIKKQIRQHILSGRYENGAKISDKYPEFKRFEKGDKVKMLSGIYLYSDGYYGKVIDVKKRSQNEYDVQINVYDKNDKHVTYEIYPFDYLIKIAENGKKISEKNYDIYFNKVKSESSVKNIKTTDYGVSITPYRIGGDYAPPINITRNELIALTLKSFAEFGLNKEQTRRNAMEYVNFLLEDK